MNSGADRLLSKHSLKFKLIVSIISVVILIILYFLEVFSYRIIHTILYFDFFSLFIYLILHVVLLRYIVVMFLFPGSNFLLKKLMKHENGKFQANQFLKIITLFKTNMNLLNTNSTRTFNMKIISTNLKQLKDITNHFLNIFSHLHQRFNQSEYQKKFSLALTILKDNLIDSNIDYIVNESFKKNELIQEFIDFQDEELNKKIKKLLLNVEAIEELILDFLLKRDWRTNYKNFWYNDTFGSIYQYRVELINKYNAQEYVVKSYDDTNLDVVVLYCDRIKQQTVNSNITEEERNSGSNIMKKTNRNLMIICGPNGSPFEQLSKTFYLEEMYLRNNVDVLFWNYRGYGFTLGNPTYENIQRDAEAVCEFARKQNMWEKIGVHGISIGGLPSCNLAGKNLVDLLIADRTFSSINDIVKNFTFGRFLSYFYKGLFFKSSKNVDNYLKSNCLKILISDPLDTIVKDSASLKTGIAKKIINAYSNNDNSVLGNILLLENQSSENFSYSNTQFSERNINHSNKKKKKLYGILEVMLSNEDIEDFVQSLIYIFNFESENEETNNKKSVSEKKKSLQTNLLLNSDNNQKRKIKYTNLSGNNINELDVETDYELQNTKDISPKLDEFCKDLNAAFSEFESAGDSLLTIKKFVNSKFKKTYCKKFVHNFFTNMFVWGCIKTDDNDFSDDIMTHREIPRRFKELIEVLESLLVRKEANENKNSTIIKSTEKVLKYIQKLNVSFSSILFKNNTSNNLASSINSSDGRVDTQDNILDFSKRIEKMNLGTYIPVSCGHNGNFSETELHLIRYEMIKLKFI